MRLLRTPAPGLDIDGFVLGERLFAGGMGSIWRATRADITFPMILKIPFFVPGEDVAAIIAYEVEEMILKRISGPHVPRFIASGDLSDIPYLAMEFVEGPSLAEAAQAAPLPGDEIVRIARLLARAVAALHRQHVIHFDLKPANIIMAERGAVLIDFGLARHDQLPDLLGEESALPMGSGAYMSPEQVVGDRSQAASDIFAIGTILFELATGAPPFGVPKTRAGLRDRLRHDPADLAPRLAALAPGLAEVILRSMAVDAGGRYPTADQMLFDLNHLDQVKLTERKPRKGAGVAGWFSGWLSAPPPAQARSRANVAQRLSSAPVILAAIDLTHGADALADAVRLHVRRVLDSEPDARLACLTVLKTKLVGEDAAFDETGRPAYLGRLVRLKDWARPLGIVEEKLAFHVIEAMDPAAAILEYARHNHIDHILMGARAASALRRHLGSVSSQVVAEARCTVTVVRLGDRQDSEPEGDVTPTGEGI